MWQNFIQNGQVGNFAHAHFSLWKWLFGLAGGWHTLAIFGVLALFLAFKPTRPFVIGLLIFAVIYF